MKERKTEPSQETISQALLSLKKKTSWSWERMCREFHRVMGEEGPSATTLFRNASGQVKRRNVLTERYLEEAIHKITVELVHKQLSESEAQRTHVEKELHQIEVRFRKLVENAKDLIYRYRLKPTLGYEYISPEVKNMGGYPPEEFYVDPHFMLKVVHPDDKAHLEQALRDPSIERVTFRWIHKSGRVVWCEAVHVPVYDEAGNQIAIEGIARDITERKQAEEVLRKQKDLLETIIERMGEGLVVADEKGAFLLWNEAAKKIVPLGPTDAPPEQWPKTYGSFLPDETTPIPWEGLPLVRALRGETPDDVEMFVRNPTVPEGKHLLVSARPLKDAESNPKGGICVFRDITERKRAQEKLRASEAKYQDLYDNAPDMFLSIDTKGKIIECNQAVAAATGYTKEEIIGLPVFDLYHPDCIEDVKKAFRSFVKTGEVRDAELEVARNDGTKIEVSLNVSSVRDEQGNILYSRSIWRDITKHKRAEEEIRTSSPGSSNRR